jgi:hypothetical protein
MWLALLAAFAVFLAAFAWRMYKNGMQIPKLSDKDAIRIFFASFPRAVKILWWFIFVSAIVVSIINSFLHDRFKL